MYESPAPEGMQVPFMESIARHEQRQRDIKAGVDVNSAAYKLGVQTSPGGIAYDGNSADSYVNALNTEKTWLREDMLRNEKYAREDNAYHRLFDEMKSLGVNPALLLSSINTPVGNAGDGSTSAFKTSNTASTDRTEAANSAKIAGSIIAALALIAAALA